MSTSAAFLFSGQGSQYYQMGSGLYKTNPVFKKHMDEMDEIVRDVTGRSVLAALYGEKSKADLFDDILLTHPAIFMVEYALAQALISEGIEPELTLGASLGSFTAATVSGCLELDEALTLVLRQAEIVKNHCPKGAMIAILAEPALFETSLLNEYSVIASKNFASHFVISTQYENIPLVETFLKRRDIVFQKLPVQYPFHSSWIDVIKARFLASASSVSFSNAAIPFFCCASAQSVDSLSVDQLWNIVRQPILFDQTIAELEKIKSFRYFDLSPSGTLATFLKYLLPSASPSRSIPVLTPYGRDMQTFADATAF